MTEVDFSLRETHFILPSHFPILCGERSWAWVKYFFCHLFQIFHML